MHPGAQGMGGEMGGMMQPVSFHGFQDGHEKQQCKLELTGPDVLAVAVSSSRCQKQ